MSDDNNELTITRIFDAPRHLVFEAWTKPEHLKKWRAPKGFTIPSSEGELRHGGKWRASIKTPEGELLRLGGVYQEIIPNEKLVYTYAWDDENGKPGHETLVTVTFADQDGKTKMHFHQAFFLDKESRDGHNGGWSECFDRLAEFLEQM